MQIKPPVTLRAIWHNSGELFVAISISAGELLHEFM